jgi:hypothetical protein
MKVREVAAGKVRGRASQGGRAVSTAQTVRAIRNPNRS